MTKSEQGSQLKDGKLALTESEKDALKNTETRGSETHEELTKAGKSGTKTTSWIRLQHRD